MNLATQYIDLGFFGTHYWYELELRLLAPAPTGMYNSGGIISTAMAQNLALQVVWYTYGFGVDLDPDEPCPAKTAACVGLSQLSLAGSWNPTGRVADLDDTATLGVIPPYCPDTAIEEIFDGSTITIIDMVIDF